MRRPYALSSLRSEKVCCDSTAGTGRDMRQACIAAVFLPLSCLPHCLRSCLQLFSETITKWGLGGFLLLVHTCLHPGVPSTKCRSQIVV
jgi:hypothetical protein